MNLNGKSSKAELNIDPININQSSASSSSSSSSARNHPRANRISPLPSSPVINNQSNKEYSFLSLDDNLSSPTSSSSSSSASAPNSNPSRLNLRSEVDHHHHHQQSSVTLTAASSSRNQIQSAHQDSSPSSALAGMPQAQSAFNSLDTRLNGGKDGGSSSALPFNSRMDMNSYEPDTPVSPTSSSSTKNKNTRGSRLGAQMGRKGAISPSGLTNPTSPPPSSSTIHPHPPSSSSTSTATSEQHHLQQQQQQQASSSSSSSSSSTSAQPISIQSQSSNHFAARSPSHLPAVGSRNPSASARSPSDLKGKWKEREQRDLIEESESLERERTIRDRDHRVKGWAKSQGAGQPIEMEEEEHLKEGPSPKESSSNGGRFQSPPYSNSGGGGRVAALAAKLAGNSSSDFSSTPPRLGAAMGTRNASSTSSSSNSNSTSNPSSNPSNLNSNSDPSINLTNIDSTIVRKEPARSPTWDRQSGSSFGTAITSDDWTSGPGNHLSINSNHSLSGSNEPGLTSHTLAAFSTSSNAGYSALTSSSPSTSPTNLFGTRRLSRTSSSGNLLSDSTAAGTSGLGDSSFGSQTSQGTSRAGRLGRLQYNKSDAISVSGPSNKGWDSRRPSAERNSLLGRASTPNLASAYRKDESLERSTRQNSGDSQASGGGGTGPSFDWKNPFAKSSSPRGSNAGVSDPTEPNPLSNPTSPSSNPPSSYRGSISSAAQPNPAPTGPPQQRELLLPALSGVRSAIADLVRPASPLWSSEPKNQNSTSPADVLAHAREDLQSGGNGDAANQNPSESSGNGATNASVAQRGSPDLGGYASSGGRSSVQTHDRKRPPSTTGSDTSGSASKPSSQGGGPHETLTRFAMSMSPLLNSLDSTVGTGSMEGSHNSATNDRATQNDPSLRNRSGALRQSEQVQNSDQPSSSGAGSTSATSSPLLRQESGVGRGVQDSPSLGQLSDEAIVQLGALPGTSPENLLNQNGTPLSSKNVLTIALKKAQSAVSLDSANNVPEAIVAYQQAVRLLREVMERIAPRNGKKSKASREEERRRLKNIHDTYAERIRLLSMIYSPDESGNDSDFDQEGEESGQGEDTRFESSSPYAEGNRSGWNDRSFADDPSMSGAADSSTSFFASRSSNASLPRDSQSQAVQNQPLPRPRDVMEELVDSDLESYGNPNRNGSLASASGQSAFDSRKGSHSSEEFSPPAISIQPESPRNKSHIDLEDQKEVLFEGRASSARQNRSDSESSFSSVQSNRGLGLNGAVAATSRSSDGSSNLEPEALSQSQNHLGVSKFGKTSNGLEDELRTPTTPFFDVDPNLGMEHEPSSTHPRFDSSSMANATGKTSASPSSASAGVPPQAFRDPFRREEHSRNAGSLSKVPDLKSLLPSRPSNHRRSSSASSASHGGSQTGNLEVNTPTASTTNTTSFPSQVPAVQEQASQKANAVPSAAQKPSALKHTSAQTAPNSTLLVSPTTSSGTISQRRNRYNPGPSSDSSDTSNSQSAVAHPRLAGLQNRNGRSDSSPSVPSRLVSSHEGSTAQAVPQEEKAKRESSQHSPQQSSGMGSAGRQRAVSQPGSKRPSIPAAFMNNPASNNSSTDEVVPPVPRMSRKASMPSSLSPTQAPEVQLPRQGAPSQPGHFRFPNPTASGVDPTTGLFLAEPFSQVEREKAFPTPKAIMNDLFPTGLLSSCSGIPSFATSPSTSILPKLAITTVIPDPMSSMTPNVLPNPTVLRPFYLMNQLSISIQRGGYVTPRLFVSKSLWSQSGARLTAIESKVRMMELVSSGIDGIEQAGKTLLLTPTGQPGLAMIQAAKFAKGLEELEILLVEVQNTLAKKLDFLKSVTGKKSNSSFGSIGSKLTRSLDRMTNGSKNLDSPTNYVDGLARLFSRSRILESHLQLLIKSQSPPSVSDDSDASSPSIEAYAALPKDLRSNIETKLKKSSDFFANVVLAFVIKDLGILLDKSLKRNGAAIAD